MTWLLFPLSVLFSWIVRYRYRQWRKTPQRYYRAPVPVIIVGNIGVGGNGKTPVVLALCQYLTQQGYHPGVVSRGYGGNTPGPCVVTADLSPTDCGDEPLLIHRRSHCPVVIAHKRPAAVELLLEQFPECDVIISDDGLQHYPLLRDIELCVVDAKRQFGNGFCLPAGPLREPLSRLQTVDRIIANGGTLNDFSSDEMILVPSQWRRVSDGKLLSDESLFTHGTAVAGIGHPQRFYQTLKELGLTVDATLEVGDHGQLTQGQIADNRSNIVLMTEKDALKYQCVAGEQWYYLSVDAQLPDNFYHFILQQLERFYAA